MRRLRPILAAVCSRLLLAACSRRRPSAAARGRRDRRAVHADRPGRAAGQRPRFRRQIPARSISATPICPDVCPIDLQTIGAGAAAVREAAIRRAAAKVQPIFITVDPARDTPAVLQAVSSPPSIPRLIGLTGTPRRRSPTWPSAYRRLLQRRRGADAGRRLSRRSQPRMADAVSGPDGEPIALLPHDKGADGRRRRARRGGCDERQLLGDSRSSSARPRGMGGPVRRLRQMLPPQARGRGYRRAPRRPTSPAGCSTGTAGRCTNYRGRKRLSCPIACG